MVASGHFANPVASSAPAVPLDTSPARNGSSNNRGSNTEHPTTPTTGGKKSKSLPVKTLLELERKQKAAAAAAAAAVIAMSDSRDGGDDAAKSPSPSRSPLEQPDRRPDSAKSKSSVASSVDDGKSSSSKSILGSLEDMVQHNFSSSVNRPPSSGTGTAGRGSANNSPVSPPRATPPKSFSVTSMLQAPPQTAAAPRGGGNKNPLAALQQFCDSTEKSSSGGKGAKKDKPMMADPGSILAFSWACNQAVVDDSVFKCPFCDTPFVSKGAYRHHLSKVHFMKDGMEAVAKAAAAAGSKDSPAGSSSSSPKAADGGDAAAESTENKYHKYAEMAKQLSSSTGRASPPRSASLSSATKA